MGLDFDVREFCQNLRATKPPYECPVKDCGKVYKSFAGIQFHLFNFNHETPGGLASSHEPLEALTFAEAQKIVEIEMGGKMQRLGIFDAIPLISKEEFEILYPAAPENSQTACNEVVKTPSAKSAALKNIHKKTPKLSATPVTTIELMNRKETIPEKSAVFKLPEAVYSILENYDLPDAPERAKSYYRFIEKTAEELEDEVEYDMDEEDFTWLELINQRRKFEGLTEVSPESFELLMDRLEKESYFLMQSSGKDQGPPIDEDAVCCICMDGECQNSNVILFCDMCNLAVHQECYGVPYIPEGQWLCRRCLQSPSRAVDCVLCPNRGGAFKQTDDGRWAHVVCALWIPEVCFANTVFLEPIDSIGNIPPARWKLTCYVCKQRGAGACIQCHKVNCYTAFHVTCAQQAGLHMKIDTVKESSTANLNVSVRKTAFCDVHTPSDSENRASAGDSYGETLRKAQSKAAFRDKMRKARKILAEKRSAAPVISVPTIPPERVQEIASSIHISGRNQFVQRLIAYWTLKRHSRNGVPLLRRLQMSHSSRRPEVQANEEEDGEKAMDLMTQLRCMQRLRQDLERARLLCELVRKREKTKRELLRVREKEFELMVSPSQYVLQNLLNTLKEKDTGEIFAEPVDVNEVTDYLTVIKQPMDLSTMQRKIDLHQYPTLEAFEKDFQLMISNCMTYNGEQTIYYKAAIKLREAAAPLFRQARKDLEIIAPDLEGSKPLAVSSGVEANKTRDEPAREGVPEKVPEKPIVEMVDAYLADKNREKDPPDHQLSKLEDLLFNVQKILPQGQQRLKRVRLLKAEMAKIRRKVSLQASGRSAATRSTNSPLKTTRNRDNTKQCRDTNSEESSGSSSDGESSSSDSDSSEEASANEEANRKIKTRARVSAAAKQLKMDSFITRSVQPRNSTSAAAAPPKETTASTDSEKNAIKNRFVAKVMKRVRAENNMTNTSTQDSEAEAETSSRAGELPTTPLKTAENSAAQGLSGSPSGVNRRTAVLFTKKAAAAFKKPESLSPASSSPPRRSIGRPRKTSESSSSLNTNAVSSVTSTSTNLFSMAVGLTEPQTSKMTTRKRQKAAENAENAVKNLFTNTSANLLATPGLSSIPSLRVPPPLPNIESDSFKVYRTSRKDDVDEDDFTRKSTSSRSSVVSSSGSESSSDSGDESASSSASSDESSVSNEQNQVQQAKIPGNLPVVPSSEIPLQPLDLVWAKCRGFPWYPALIVDPKWPRSGYVHNGVPIPVPPDDVLTMKVSSQEPLFLVLFFDAKRKWLWLPRNKLEPLGVDPDCDKAKLMEAKKPAERKAVKKAYEEAILHQCRVSGQGVSLSEESSSEDSD